jgi:hypothetical protein
MADKLEIRSRTVELVGRLKGGSELIKSLVQDEVITHKQRDWYLHASHSTLYLEMRGNIAVYTLEGKRIKRRTTKQAYDAEMPV